MELKDIIGAIVGVVGAIPSYIMAFIAWDKWRKRSPGSTVVKWLGEVRHSYPFMLGIFFSLVMVVLFVAPFGEGKPEITIISPLNNVLVSQNITVEGYANRELSEDEHLYIVVECGGLWWPQYNEVTVGYFQATERYEFHAPARIGREGETGQTFIIRGILVDSAIHQHFQSWFQQHILMEDWPGIPRTEVSRLGKAEICDSITVIRR